MPISQNDSARSQASDEISLYVVLATDPLMLGEPTDLILLLSTTQYIANAGFPRAFLLHRSVPLLTTADRRLRQATVSNTAVFLLDKRVKEDIETSISLS